MTKNVKTLFNFRLDLHISKHCRGQGCNGTLTLYIMKSIVEHLDAPVILADYFLVTKNCKQTASYESVNSLSYEWTIKSKHITRDKNSPKSFTCKMTNFIKTFRKAPKSLNCYLKCCILLIWINRRGSKKVL